MSTAVENPFSVYLNLKGVGLNNGSLYVGVANMDPESDPQAVYWNEELTIPAAQPLEVQGGYAMRLGTPARAYTASSYSMRVRNQQGDQVFYVAETGRPSTDTTTQTFDTIILAQAAEIPDTITAAFVLGYYDLGDGGGALYRRVVAQPSHAGKFQSADGSWWEISTTSPTIRMFGARGNGATNDSVQVQGAVDFATQFGLDLDGAGLTYVTVSSISIITGAKLTNAVFDHRPNNMVTDCLVLAGSTAANTFKSIRLTSVTVKGRQSGTVNGRHGISIIRGDQIQLTDVFILTPVLDGVHVEGAANFDWVENLTLQNVKVQSPGRDGFNFTVLDGLTDVFINQVSLIQCETRSAVRYTEYAWCRNTGLAANKISNFSHINCELSGASGTAAALVKLEGPASGGSIENFRYVDTAIEDTAAGRTGPGIEVTGRCTGKLIVDNCILYGMSGLPVSGYALFAFYEIYDGDVNSIIYRSHQGIIQRYRTAALVTGGTENCNYALRDGEILKLYVLERYNNGAWRGEWTVFDTDHIFEIVANNVTLSIVTVGPSNFIAITNTSPTTTPLELFIQRVLRDPAT